MTQDQIERRAEWMMDNLDRHFTRKPHQCDRCRKTVPNDRGMIECWYRECPEPMTQATYDAKCREIDAWAEAEYAKCREAV